MRLTVFALFALALLPACGGGSGADVGTLQLKITDAPFPATDGCVSAAWVAVTEVSAKGPEGFVTLLEAEEDPVRIDLFDLRAGLSEVLAVAEIPTGAYTEVRLVIDEATIEFDGDSPARDFKVPSGSSSGLKVKIQPPVLVAAGQTADVTLDVNLTESFRTTGLGGEPTCDDLKQGDSQVIFHPVIRAINEAETALLQGIVRDAGGVALADAEVLVYPAGTTVADETEAAAMTLSTPDGMGDLPEGSYALALEPGSYDLYVRAQGAETRALVASDVALEAGDLLAQDLVLP